VKSVDIAKATLDDCLPSGRAERVLLTRRGRPLAIVVDVRGMDMEQIELGSSDEFWKMIAERRRQPTISRAELERRLKARDAKRRKKAKAARASR
jgi:hypothetical protein